MSKRIIFWYGDYVLVFKYKDVIHSLNIIGEVTLQTDLVLNTEINDLINSGGDFYHYPYCYRGTMYRPVKLATTKGLFDATDYLSDNANLPKTCSYSVNVRLCFIRGPYVPELKLIKVVN